MTDKVTNISYGINNALSATSSCKPPPVTTTRCTNHSIPPINALPFGGSINRTAAKWTRKLSNRRARKTQTKNTAIVDSGASGIYLREDAPKVAITPSAPTVRVGTAAGEPVTSSATCKLALPTLPEDFPTGGHVMPGFRENLVGIGPMCDAGYTVSFTDEAVVISKDDGIPILHGWREQDGPKLWRILLLPDHDSVKTVVTDPTTQRESLVAYSAYDLPSVEALVRYFHAAAGFPVKDTWLSAIKAGHFASWPGLTYKNAAKYCPMSDETLKGHMVQTRQNIRSTRPTQGPLKFQRSTTVPTIDSAAFLPSLGK